MKKGIVLLLAVVFVIAFAQVAMAAQPAGWNAPGPTYRDPVVTDSPHGSYLTSGDECEVCHSPHQAGTAGTTYKLLRSGSANACDYCHDADGLAAAYRVYVVAGVDAKTGINGHEIGAFPNTAGVLPDNGAASALVGTSLECYDCHTVHGAGAIAAPGQIPYNTSVAGVPVTLNATKPAILKENPAGDGDTATTINGFCADCHDLNLDVAYAETDVTHYMGTGTAAGGPRGNANVSNGDSAYCGDCHIDDVETVTNRIDYSWPHVSYGDALINLSNDGGPHDGTNPITRASMDANCLLCHNQVGTAY